MRDATVEINAKFTTEHELAAKALPPFRMGNLGSFPSITFLSGPA